MKYPGWVLTIIVAAALLTSGYAQVGPTEESLKVVHDTVINSVTKGNVPAVQAVMHPQALGFFRESQFPAQVKGGFTTTDALSSVLAELTSFVALPTTANVYRVVGNVGLALMTATLEPHKGEKKKLPRYLRGTYVYVWNDGYWKLLSWHSSDTPLAQK
ncbi:MAG: hypothetical protein EHM23_22060 [Acidobacteria bacterium]|nr:MAG: hypothetical protein EHM23_22060 [Acidobacteriota bacterium]